MNTEDFNEDYFLTVRENNTRIIGNTIVSGTGIKATKSDTAYIGNEIIPFKTLEERIRVCKLVIDKWAKTKQKAIYTQQLLELMTRKIKRDYCE